MSRHKLVLPTAAEADALALQNTGQASAPLQQAAALLDPGQLSQLLQRPAKATHVRIKPGHSVVIAHLSQDRTGQSLAGWTMVTVDENKWRKAAVKAEVSETALTTHHKGGPWLFSGDILGDPALAKELAETADIRHLHSDQQVLRYNPRRRAVFTLGSGKQRQVLRVASTSLKSLAESSHHWRAAGIPVGAVRLVGHRGTAALSPFWGVGDLSFYPHLPAAETAGAALAALHQYNRETIQQPSRDTNGTRPTPPAPNSLQAASQLGIIAPWAAQQAHRLSEKLEAFWDQHVEKPAWDQIAQIHGDFSPDQVLLAAPGSHKIRLIDFDRSAPGDPMQDLGSWAAACRRLNQPDLLHALLRGYSQNAPVIPDRLRYWEAWAHLLGAGDFFRRRATDWPAKTHHALTCAEEALIP